MKLPPHVYRALAAVKAEGTVTSTGLADALDVTEDEAISVINALLWLGWMHEQILIDHSSEYVLSVRGIEVSDEGPRLGSSGYPEAPKPVFKDPEYVQQDLL